MPTSVSLTFAMGYRGSLTGISGNPALETLVSRVTDSSLTGTGKQAYIVTSLSIAGAATTTLDLTTGLTNPLNESIASAAAFAQVYGYVISHDVASLSTTGITAFGGASNDFQGPWAAGDKVTLTPGKSVAYIVDESKTGDTVDATHKNIALVNLHATLAATVHVAIFGKVA